MLVSMKRLAVAGSIAVGAMLAATLAVSTQSLPSCDPDNGGIKLPAGFCALVVADNIGPARHLTVAPNGDVFAALQTTGGRGAPPTGGGVVALRDTDRDGRLETQERFGSGSITGIALRNGYLYVGKFNSIERYKMADGQLKPASDMPETVVTGLPGVFQHGDKGIAFDGKGGLYVNVGAPSNACHQPDRRPGATGRAPPLPQPVSRRLEGLEPRVRTPVRSSKRTAASGSSMKTSSSRSRRTARDSPPGSPRCRPLPGTTVRSTRP